MQEPQGLIQNLYKNILCDMLCHSVFTESRLDSFDVPVAELIPEERVYSFSGYVEIVILHCICDLFNGSLKPGENPAIFEFKDFLCKFYRYIIIKVHYCES